MEFEEIREWLEHQVRKHTGQNLTPPEWVVLECSWEGQSYLEMGAHNYAARYLQGIVGPALWRTLSKVFGEEIRKRNHRFVLERRFQRDRSAEAASSSNPYFSEPDASDSQSTPSPVWGQAPDASVFYGRSQDLDVLQQWVEEKRYRLITVSGLAGVGKSVIVKRLAENLQQNYRVIWESLAMAPLLPQLITRLLRHLMPPERIPDSAQSLSDQLMEWLRRRPCLIVLDGLDAILQPHSETGSYRAGYEYYGHLLEQLGSTKHSSCVIVTSRELPSELRRSMYTRPFWLGGLEPASAPLLFEHLCLSVDNPNTGTRLFAYYAGNPKILHTVASTIHNVYNRQVRQFLDEMQYGVSILPDVYIQFQPLLDGLPAAEQELMYWLAVALDPLSREALRDRLLSFQARQQLTSTLDALQRRSLVQIEHNHYALYPFVRELLIRNLIERSTREVLTGTPECLHTHALLWAQGISEHRQHQRQSILKPIAERLTTEMGRSLNTHLRRLLQTWQHEFYETPTYAIGNLLNLCIHLEIPLENADLSHLYVEQAYLQRAQLLNVNLAHSNISTSVFIKSLGSHRAIALDPTGQRIAVGDERGFVQVWAVDSGRAELTDLEDWAAVTVVQFSPDGKWLMAGDAEGTLRRWDLEQQCCTYVRRDHQKAIRCLEFSPNGRHGASGGEDGVLRVWNIETGRPHQALQHEAGVIAIAFSPDGQRLASLTQDQRVFVWTLTTGTQDRTLDPVWPYPIEAITFTNKGYLIAAAAVETKIQVWGLCEEKQLHFNGHEDSVSALSIGSIRTPDPQLLCSSGRDRTGKRSIRIWNLQTGDKIRTIPTTSDSTRLFISRDGTCIATDNRDRSIQVWDSRGRLRQTLYGYNCSVHSFAVSADGRSLAVGDNCNIVRLWNLPVERQQHLLMEHRNWISALTYSPDSQRIASGDEDGMLRVWDVQTGNSLMSIQGHQGAAIRALGFSPDGQQLVSGCEAARVKVWAIAPSLNVQTEDVQPEPEYQHNLIGHADAIRAVAFNAEGTLLATCSVDHTIRVWSLVTGQCLQTLAGHDSWVHTLCFALYTPLLISGSYDRTIRYWNLDTGECDRVWEYSADLMHDVVCTPRGQLYAVSVDVETAVRLWDLSTQACFGSLQSTQTTQKAGFSATGDRVITVQQGGELVQVWDTASQYLLHTFRTNTPYQGMNITGVQGLSERQNQTLKILGAVEE